VEIVKKCSKCSAEYTLEQFKALPHVGNQMSQDEEGEYLLELRNCPCHSTIGIETKLSNPSK